MAVNDDLVKQLLDSAIQSKLVEQEKQIETLLTKNDKLIAELVYFQKEEKNVNDLKAKLGRMFDKLNETFVKLNIIDIDYFG